LDEDALTRRVPLLHRKHLSRKEFAKLFSQGLSIAAERAQMNDGDSTADAMVFSHLLPILLFSRQRPGDPVALRGTPWLETVRGRLGRLQGGEY
jgi:hypothetical protein